MPIHGGWATASSVSLSHWYTSLNQPIVQTPRPPPPPPAHCSHLHHACPLWKAGQRLLSARLFTDQRFSSGFQIDGIIFLIKRARADEGGWGKAGERTRLVGAGLPRPPRSLLARCSCWADGTTCKCCFFLFVVFFSRGGRREVGED